MYVCMTQDPLYDTVHDTVMVGLSRVFRVLVEENDVCMYVGSLYEGGCG